MSIYLIYPQWSSIARNGGGICIPVRLFSSLEKRDFTKSGFSSVLGR